MTTLDVQRTTLLDDAQSILTRAKSANRELTDTERKTVRSNLDDAARLMSQIKNSHDDGDLRRRLGDVLRDDLPSDGKVGRFSARRAASSLAEKMSASAAQSKALAPFGSVVAPAGLTEPTPIPLGRPVPSLLSALGAITLDTPPTYAYLRQTERVNNAAVVASGGQKPTSRFGLERIESRLRVVAHISEEIDRFWLEDSAELRTFVESELTTGLDEAIESVVVNGDGVGENPRGLLNTAGIQLQPWSVDSYETLRKAITKTQIVGGTAPVIVLHPGDFEAASLTRTTTGQFLTTDAYSRNVSIDGGGSGTVSTPVGSDPLLSWGVPIVLSVALPVGTGLVFDADAVRLYVDGTVRTEWNPFAGFTTNEVVARCETRVDVAVRKPMSVVSVDLTAA